MTDDEQRGLAADIAYALRYSLQGRPLPKGQRWPDADLAAERVVEHVLRCGWELRKLPPERPHTAGGAEPDPVR